METIIVNGYNETDVLWESFNTCSCFASRPMSSVFTVFTDYDSNAFSVFSINMIINLH